MDDVEQLSLILPGAAYNHRSFFILFSALIFLPYIWIKTIIIITITLFLAEYYGE
jgi:hypothetical protein